MSVWSPRARRQRGVALIVALIFLLLMAMIGVTGMRITTMQERMAGNAHDRNVAFQAAEAALRAAEIELFGKAVPPAAGDHDYYYADDDALFVTMNWWADWDNNVPNTASVTIDGAGGGQYVVRERGALQIGTTVSAAGTQLQQVHMYEVTARGVGKNPNTEVFLQTTYKYGSQ